MPIQGFDYKGFAASMLSQLQEILTQPNSVAVPDVVTAQDKKFIMEIVKKFCLMSGEALYNDPNIKFTADQACMIVQFIAEWTFHKSIDMITGKVPLQSRPLILQRVAGEIFNTTKIAFVKNFPADKLPQLVEEKVKITYNDELQKLVKKGEMSQSQCSVAMSASNLDATAEKTQDAADLDKANKHVEANAPTQSDKKILKLVALAIILKNLPQEKAEEILKVLDKTDVQHVINYMKTSNIEDKIDHKLIIKSLEEMKEIIPLPETANTRKTVQKFHKLLEAAPPDVLSNIAINEREAVKDFILDLTCPAEKMFSPLVIQSLVKSVEDKINDN